MVKDSTYIYRQLLLNNLSLIYKARKNPSRTDWNRFSDLLVEKFANHSSTYFHLLTGFIEHKNSTPNRRIMGFDIFSINSLIRVLIETYITFNHIFVSPISEDEKYFRFLLWQLDGLMEKQKFKIEPTVFKEAQSILEHDREKIIALNEEIKNCRYYNLIPKGELEKIYTPANKKVAWKFTITENFEIKTLQITQLIQFIFPGRVFSNIYKYSSIYSHSGYLSIEHFERVRGKEISDSYVTSYTEQGIYLTAFLIKDLCTIDENASLVYSSFLKEEQIYIAKINSDFRHTGL